MLLFFFSSNLPVGMIMKCILLTASTSTLQVYDCRKPLKISPWISKLFYICGASVNCQISYS